MIVSVMLVAVLAVPLFLAGCGGRSSIRLLQEEYFSLEITVDSKIFAVGTDINVDIVFTNLVDYSFIVEHGSPMIVVRLVDELVIHHEGGATESVYAGIRREVLLTGTIMRNEIIVFSIEMGSRLPIGEFDIIAEAVFSARGTNDFITIVSNIITLTVI